MYSLRCCVLLSLKRASVFNANEQCESRAKCRKTHTNAHTLTRQTDDKTLNNSCLIFCSNTII